VTGVAAALAGSIGFALGLLGAGGSILMVPALTYLAGFDPKQSIVISLAVVGMAAAAGALSSLLRKTIPFRPVAIIDVAVMLGAYAGARVGVVLSSRTQLTMLAVLMIAAALMMWHRSRPSVSAPSPSRAPSPVALGALGIGLGGVTGMVGVGGGFLIVPALVLAGGLPIHQAAGASLFAIALATTGGLAGYAGRVAMPWGFVLPFAAIASAGTITGGLVAHRMPQRRLQQVFAVALLAVAAFMLARG
jgi:uncharacterized membrane protein YfcA